MQSSKEKVLITGGSGFVGMNLMPRLSQSYDVLAIGTTASPPPIASKRIDLTRTDFSFLKNLSPDYVVHLAGYSSPQLSSDHTNTMQLNGAITVQFLEALRKKNVKKFIFMSTALLYADSEVPVSEDSPLNRTRNAYCASKALAEDACMKLMEKGFPITIFRASNMYGPHQRWKDRPTLIPQIIVQAIRERRITILNTTPIRDWLYVDDACDAIMKALTSPATGIFNLGSGKGVSVGDIVSLIQKMSPCTVTNLQKKVNGPKMVVCDIHKITEETGWKPTTVLKDGLRKTYKHYLDFSSQE